MRCHTQLMKVITQREFRNNSAAVMDEVESGETFRVTRNGIEVAELRPVSRRQRLTAEELVERHRRLPRVDYTLMCQAAAGAGQGGRLERRPGCVVPAHRPCTGVEEVCR
ncbi:type II toxin-antitoxin system Phd/YefM family antitoxin [Nocardia sp. NBC_01730]|uniref:type II toxin-antitoxin system Phd/YefM family antitoxin n=1 Tax=Nocardia sp. NBC_01730 TaxID=2975998 RepID=UPI003FA38145